MSKPFKKGTALLVTSQVSQRSGLRKTLFDMGVENKLIDVAADYEQAKLRLSSSPVNLLVTDDEIGKDKKGMDLIDLHRQNNPNSAERIFVLMVNESSPFLMADFSLKCGDILINKPFTNVTFTNTLSQAITTKEKLSPEECLALEIQDALRGPELDKAQNLMKKFKNPESVHALYSKAIINESNHEREAAYENFKKVIKLNADFKSLVGLIKLGTGLQKHFEMIEYVELWLKKFPLHHNSLLDIARIIIANEKFELLDEIFDLFSRHKINDSFAKVPLAAGFAMASAHHFENGRKEKTRDYALKAIEYSGRKISVVSKGLEMLVKAGASVDAEKAYLKLDHPIVSNEDKVMDIKLRNIIYPKNKVLVECQKLLSQKVTDPDLYRITINCLKEIGKDPGEIIQQARQTFPNQKFE